MTGTTTMRTQHNPGPWKLEKRGYTYVVSDPRSGWITRDVCRMDGSTMAAFWQEGNAELIAAAPDLRESLQGAANYIDTLGGDSKPYRVLLASLPTPAVRAASTPQPPTPPTDNL